MIVNYGYSDGNGEYYVAIDTDKCDGCAKCVTACPEKVFEVAEDDYGKVVAKVKDAIRGKLGYVCPGFYAVCSRNDVNCRSVCAPAAISHTW